MNQREAAYLKSAADKLRHGPGSGWLEYMENRPPFHGSSEDRAAAILRWLECWILPAIDGPADRYGRKEPTA